MTIKLARRHPLRSAFTLPELLVVVGVIALLIAVLLPALAGGKPTADMTRSMSNMKQIGIWMQLYASENRETILPSQFDYTAAAANYQVKVRSDAALGALQYKGTWTDILWTYNDLGAKQSLETFGQTYRYDSPDKAVYDQMGSYDENPFRASAPNSHDTMINCTAASGPTPFGTGATEAGIPGYFAANNFFDTGPATGPLKWWVTGQIKAPDRSMYLVDSHAGETIEDDTGISPSPFDNTKLWDCDGDGTNESAPMQADFRYNGVCLMLLLDGHTAPQTPWADIVDLAKSHRIRVQNLDRN